MNSATPTADLFTVRRHSASCPCEGYDPDCENTRAERVSAVDVTNEDVAAMSDEERAAEEPRLMKKGLLIIWTVGIGFELVDASDYSAAVEVQAVAA